MDSKLSASAVQKLSGVLSCTKGKPTDLYILQARTTRISRGGPNEQNEAIACGSLVDWPMRQCQGG